MQVRTFTNFWSMERKLYAINDITLPTPVSLRSLGVFVLTGVPWWFILWIIHVPFGNPWYLVYAVVPGAAAFFGTKPVYQGKTIFQYAQSQVLYLLLESKRYKGLEVDKELPGEKFHTTQHVFVRKMNTFNADAD